MTQTRRMAAQTVCHFSRNADFCQLRISKYPANALKTNYFSVLGTGYNSLDVSILRGGEGGI